MLVKLVSYNIRLGLDSSIDRIASSLRPLDADIIVLQEVGLGWHHGDRTNHAGRLAASLDLHYRYFPALYEQLGHYGIALLSRVLPHTLSTVQHACIDGEQRVCVTASYETFDLVTTHLAICDADRGAQVDYLAKLLAGQHRPFILAGDLNCEHESAQYRRLLASGHDCRSDNVPTYPTKTPAVRIDHIIASNDFDVIRPTRVLDIHESDHLPICATLALEISS